MKGLDERLRPALKGHWRSAPKQINQDTFYRLLSNMKYLMYFINALQLDVPFPRETEITFLLLSVSSVSLLIGRSISCALSSV